MALSKRDFLDGIVGKSVDYTVEGLGDVKIKSLNIAATKEIQNEYAEDPIGAALVSVIYGMVEPQLDKDDLATLYEGKPGVIMQLAKRISELSGLVEDTDDSPN